MRTSVFTVDFQAIGIGLTSFRKETKKEPSYIVMSDKTKSALVARVAFDCADCVRMQPQKESYYTTYQGIPIAVCDNLDFGIIEIV